MNIKTTIPELEKFLADAKAHLDKEASKKSNDIGYVKLYHTVHVSEALTCENKLTEMINSFMEETEEKFLSFVNPVDFRKMEAKIKHNLAKVLREGRLAGSGTDIKNYLESLNTMATVPEEETIAA